MATSGTVGQTTLSFADIIDLALRRCRLNPAVILTPEMTNTARKAMFLVMTSLANRGLNLWRVEHGFLGLKTGQIQYDLPVSTIRIVDLNFVNNAIVSNASLGSIVGGYQLDLPDNYTTSRFGFKPTVTFTAALSVFSSPDGVSFTQQKTIDSATYNAGTWYWFDLPVTESIKGIQITSATAFTLSEMQMSASNYLIPMKQWNRDSYAQQPQRTQPGRPSTNYYFDRQINAQLFIWPNVQSDYDHLEYWLHRHIQDINLLTEEIDVPTRWYNAVVALLAKEFAFLVPSVESEARQLVIAQAEATMQEAEMGETDGSSIFIQPQIRGYTR